MREAGYGDGFDVALTCTNDRYVNDERPVPRARRHAWPDRHAGAAGDASPPRSISGRSAAPSSISTCSAGGVTTFDSEYIFSLLYHTNTGALGGWNGTRFSDRAVDDQIHTLRQEVDQTRRNATIAALWRRLKEEVVYVPLHNQTITHAMSREFDIPVDVSNQPKMKFIAPARCEPASSSQSTRPEPAQAQAPGLRTAADRRRCTPMMGRSSSRSSPTAGRSRGRPGSRRARRSGAAAIPPR
jgi:peptide/nickel transport system substrate-binding protein